MLITVMGNIILALLIYFMGIPGVSKGYSSALLNRYIFGYPVESLFPSIVVLVSMVGYITGTLWSSCL